MTHLHEAAVKGHPEICQEIISSLISNNITEINTRDHKSWTPLHTAVAHVHKEVWRSIATSVQNQQGHLEMCQTTFCSQVIMNVTNLHPRDDKGKLLLGELLTLIQKTMKV